MPKLTSSDKEKADNIVRACIKSNQELYSVTSSELTRRVGIVDRTLRNRMVQPEGWRLEELRRAAKALKWTPLQCASILMGRPMTAKEIKDFIML